VTTYLAMLRGINVGGHAKVPMAELRATFLDLGYDDVATYIQSGNVLFGASDGAATVHAAVEAALESRFGLALAVVLRSRAQLGAVVKANPLTRAGRDPAKLHVTFLSAPPPSSRVNALDPRGFLPDEFEVSGREVYLHCPDGYGRTKLNNTFLERKLGGPATTRSWKTVMTLVQMAG
jgi:uncharacterized protein (DUF1697 family)